MLAPKFNFLLLGLISMASVCSSADTTTTTTGITTTTTTFLYTSTARVQGDDTTISEALTLTQAAPTPHVPGTTTLKADTTTVTAAAPTATVTSHACTNFHLSFGKSCCPKKSHCHKKKKPKKHSKKGKKNPRGISAEEINSIAKRQQYAVDPSNGNSYYRCGSIEYEDNSLGTSLGQETVIYNQHVFTTPKYVLFADIQYPNVCGDLLVDGVVVGSTTCPEITGNLPGNGDTNANDAQAAIAAGIYGYGFFYIPAGTHTVSFKETYSGGAATFALYPACEVQVELEYSATETQTSSSATPTETLTLDPTLTVTQSFSETVFTTPAAVTDYDVTETPSKVTATETPAAVPTTVYQCNEISVNIQCPRLTSSKQINKWMVSKLNYYNGKAGVDADVGVTCGSYDWSEYYYY